MEGVKAEFVGYDVPYTGGESSSYDDALVCCSCWVEGFDESVLMLECSSERCEIIVCSFYYFDCFDASSVVVGRSVAFPTGTGDDGDFKSELE